MAIESRESLYLISFHSLILLLLPLLLYVLAVNEKLFQVLKTRIAILECFG